MNIWFASCILYIFRLVYFYEKIIEINKLQYSMGQTISSIVIIYLQVYIDNKERFT